MVAAVLSQALLFNVEIVYLLYQVVAVKLPGDKLDEEPDSALNPALELVVLFSHL